ncbi:MAG: peptidase M17 [Treponema sp.]|nr:peptidase M17 [Treponema sp.]
MSLLSSKPKTPAQTVIQEVCKIKKDETVLIIANPETNLIAQDLYLAAVEADAKPTLMFQPKKTIMDMAEKAVVGAIKSEPDVIFSISANKLGKDADAIANPYTMENGETYDNTFDYLLSGKKCIRAVWTPGLTQDMFNRTVQIDYELLRQRCESICELYKDALTVHVTAPGGTDVLVPVNDRKALVDDGDFSKPGSGGNVPSGEVFISPQLAGVGESKGINGTIVFDGSMTFSSGDAMLKTPITVKVSDGFVTDISGGEEAKRLLKDVTAAEKEALQMEASGRLEKGQGEIYSRNARNIRELGIGLNPAANITGNMLEDEKAFRTCHFAIGQNYDGDAPALIHFDGIVREPTIVINYRDGHSYTLVENGNLKLD